MTGAGLSQQTGIRSNAVMSNIKVTVLMPVYNGERFLREAIESILGQTFKDFEFLIINDGSSDNTVSIIQSYKDPRIRLVNNERNLGLIATLNRGISLAEGEYIARMDCDDISMPKRLQRQMDLMGKKKDVGVCGTWSKLIGDSSGEMCIVPVDHNSIYCALLFESRMVHPSVMFRKSFLDKCEIKYSPEYVAAEDYELWSRAIRQTHFENIPEPLLQYRIHAMSTNKRIMSEQLSSCMRIRIAQLERFGFKMTGAEVDLHQKISTLSFFADKKFLVECEKWLVKLLNANQVQGIYPKKEFLQLLKTKWFEICGRSTNLGVWTFNEYRGSLFAKDAHMARTEIAAFLVKCIFRWQKIADLIKMLMNNDAFRWFVNAGRRIVRSIRVCK